jgi:two-component system, NarL family, nitrate/nitrite response regulator NarL
MEQPVHPGPGAIRVLIADNTRIHSQLLADAMKRDRRIQVLAAVSSYREFLELAARLPFDVVLISSNLDEQPSRGFELLRALRALRPNVPAIMLLDSSRREIVLEAFRAGARGIFAKDGQSRALCKCVRRVHEGQVWANGSELTVALDALATPGIRAVDAKGITLLSKRELNIVQLLADGLTNLEIGQRLNLSKHTIKNYLVRIFDRLGVANRIELLTMTMAQPAATGEILAGVEASQRFSTARKRDSSLLRHDREDANFPQATPSLSPSLSVSGGSDADAPGETVRGAPAPLPPATNAA